MSDRPAILALATAIWLAALAPAALADNHRAAEPSATAEGRIMVSGAGTAEIAPDMAIVELTVLREGQSAREALDGNNAAMKEVLAAMRREGIAERDLQTSGFRIEPVFSYPSRETDPPQEPKITAYRVANSLSVRIRDLDRLGALLDLAVTLGVNQDGQIRFTNDEPSAALDEARTGAVQEAVAKAETLARAAGVSLGRILEISERAEPRPPMPLAETMAMARDAGQAVPVARGENSYRVDVEMVFALEEQPDDR